MRFTPQSGAPEVALTLDACMGATDLRILNVLVDNAIPATIFATGVWLKRNPAAIKVLAANRDLFAVENHGARHLAAVIGTERPYGIEPVGTADGLFAEVMGGKQAVTDAFGIAPKWYRDATALYSPSAVGPIASMGFGIAGFSLNGDIGASVSAKVARSRIAAARSGDVILSHINQPTRPAGAGVAAGILDLRARGFKFMHLNERPIAAA